MIWKLAGLAGGLVLPLAVLNAVPPYTGPYPLLDGDHAAPMHSSGWAFAKPALKVLFIGNSFTFINDMPAMLVNTASDDPNAPVRLDVSTSTIPGAPLSQAWTQGDALKLMRSRHFDIVVLQEQSAWPFRQPDIEDAYDSVGRWAAAARAAGARPVLFETWADKAGSRTYQHDWICDGLTPRSAQSAIAQATDKLAAAYDLPIVSVGDHITDVAQTPGAPDLFRADGHHPSQAGALVSALVFYRWLTGEAPTRSSYRPPELTLDDAQKVKTLLSQ